MGCTDSFQLCVAQRVEFPGEVLELGTLAALISAGEVIREALDESISAARRGETLLGAALPQLLCIEHPELLYAASREGPHGAGGSAELGLGPAVGRLLCRSLLLLVGSVSLVRYRVSATTQVAQLLALIEALELQAATRASVSQPLREGGLRYSCLVDVTSTTSSSPRSGAFGVLGASAPLELLTHLLTCLAQGSLAGMKHGEAERLRASRVTTRDLLVVLLWEVLHDLLAHGALVDSGEATEVQEASGASKAPQALHHEVVIIVGVPLFWRAPRYLASRALHLGPEAALVRAGEGGMLWLARPSRRRGGLRAVEGADQRLEGFRGLRKPRQLVRVDQHGDPQESLPRHGSARAWAANRITQHTQYGLMLPGLAQPQHLPRYRHRIHGWSPKR
mmetsp:Transcript_77647/g.174089  ORF Transcript_77647/g.174089 Transcript_77647/m.174089 type:complete len:394 (+) Transcript_77647:407-1588(+)